MGTNGDNQQGKGTQHIKLGDCSIQVIDIECSSSRLARLLGGRLVTFDPAAPYDAKIEPTPDKVAIAEEISPGHRFVFGTIRKGKGSPR